MAEKVIQLHCGKDEEVLIAATEVVALRRLPGGRLDAIKTVVIMHNGIQLYVSETMEQLRELLDRVGCSGWRSPESAVTA